MELHADGEGAATVTLSLARVETGVWPALRDMSASLRARTPLQAGRRDPKTSDIFAKDRAQPAADRHRCIQMRDLLGLLIGPPENHRSAFLSIVLLVAEVLSQVTIEEALSS